MADTNTENHKQLRIAALADLHMQESLVGAYQNIFLKINEKADVLLLCGDLTDHGYAKEAQLLVQELKGCTIPILAILGNHDFTNNQQDDIRSIICSDSVTTIDDQTYVINDVGFVGVKGFAGGFDKHQLGVFGEEAMKKFVYEAINESLKLEELLSDLDTKKKVVVLHYAPIRDTVVGEPEEVYSFMGSSRLLDPINNFDVNLVFHGHAHRGSPEGRTVKNIPVYNVSFPVRKRVDEREPYLIIEI